MAKKAAEETVSSFEKLPQGLKPDIFSASYGTTEVVP
jgi:hypothetical protein